MGEGNQLGDRNIKSKRLATAGWLGATALEGRRRGPGETGVRTCRRRRRRLPRCSQASEPPLRNADANDRVMVALWPQRYLSLQASGAQTATKAPGFWNEMEEVRRSVGSRGRFPDEDLGIDRRHAGLPIGGLAETVCFSRLFRRKNCLLRAWPP